MGVHGLACALMVSVLDLCLVVCGFGLYEGKLDDDDDDDVSEIFVRCGVTKGRVIARSLFVSVNDDNTAGK